MRISIFGSTGPSAEAFPHGRPVQRGSEGSLLDAVVGWSGDSRRTVALLAG
jgi:hypothetical protein